MGVHRNLLGSAVAADGLRWLPGALGIERLQATLHGAAYAPHRHDTYAIGVTLRGVQSFRYRGRTWHGLPGQLHVLHPDELHDGRAGTDDAFGYRIVYVDPLLVREAPGGGALPFVAAAVQPGPWPHEGPFDEPLDEAAAVELVTALADLLRRAAGAPAAPPLRLAEPGLRRVRERIAAAPARAPAMADLERIAGLDRWTLARQFRAAFGTSPSRYRKQRQLEAARRLLADGVTLASAAAEAGFADQSHLTRQFKRAYGITPARYVHGLACWPSAPAAS